jgi:hypothetical protein
MYPLLGQQEAPRLDNVVAKPSSNPAAFQRVQKGSSISISSKSVPIRFWNGPFLESFVLFPVNQKSASRDLVTGAKAFIDQLREVEKESSNQFKRLEW